MFYFNNLMNYIANINNFKKKTGISQNEIENCIKIFVRGLLYLYEIKTNMLQKGMKNNIINVWLINELYYNIFNYYIPQNIMYILFENLFMDGIDQYNL